MENLNGKFFYPVVIVSNLYMTCDILRSIVKKDFINVKCSILSMIITDIFIFLMLYGNY